MKETVNVLYAHVVYEGNSKCIYCTLMQYMKKTVNVLYTHTIYERNSKCIEHSFSI